MSVCASPFNNTHNSEGKQPALMPWQPFLKQPFIILGQLLFSIIHCSFCSVLDFLRGFGNMINMKKKFWLDGGGSCWRKTSSRIVFFSGVQLKFKMGTVDLIVVCQRKGITCYSNWSIHGVLPFKADKHHGCGGCGCWTNESIPQLCSVLELVSHLKHLLLSKQPCVTGNWCCKDNKSVTANVLLKM